MQNIYSDKQKLREFGAIIPALQKALKEVLQAINKYIWMEFKSI